MKQLLITIAALSLFVTGCASDNEAQPAPAPAAAAAPAPVYPATCNKLRQCIDAYKAQAPAAAPEYESLWDKVKGANSRSAKEASDFCAMSLRGYANKTGAPMSCK